MNRLRAAAAGAAARDFRVAGCKVNPLPCALFCRGGPVWPPCPEGASPPTQGGHTGPPLQRPRRPRVTSEPQGPGREHPACGRIPHVCGSSLRSLGGSLPSPLRIARRFRPGGPPPGVRDGELLTLVPPAVRDPLAWSCRADGRSSSPCRAGPRSPPSPSRTQAGWPRAAPWTTADGSACSS